MRVVRRGGSALAAAGRAVAATLLLAIVIPSVGGAQECDTGLEADCDGDTFTLAEGDCDDADPDVHPVAKEACGDELDNDCDGLFDEDCDKSVEQGTIGGGGGCTAGTSLDGTEAALFLPLLLLGLRRREGSR